MYFDFTSHLQSHELAVRWMYSISVRLFKLKKKKGIKKKRNVIFGKKKKRARLTPIKTFNISSCLTITRLSWPRISLAAWLSPSTPLGSGGMSTGPEAWIGVERGSKGSYAWNAWGCAAVDWDAPDCSLVSGKRVWRMGLRVGLTWPRGTVPSCFFFVIKRSPYWRPEPEKGRENVITHAVLVAVKAGRR